MPDAERLQQAIVARRFLERIREIADEFRSEVGGEIIDEILPDVESTITTAVPEATDT